MKLCNWGKYRGIAIDQLPLSYILWCLENFEAIDPNRAIILEEYHRRNTVEDSVWMHERPKHSPPMPDDM